MTPDTQETEPWRAPEKFNFAIDVVDAQALSFPDRRAMIWSDEADSQTLDLSYRHFSQRSHCSAQLLQELGIRKGDVMMMLLPRVPAWWEIATGALRAGIVVSPCTTLATPKDIAFRARSSKAKIIVGDTTTLSAFLQVRNECPTVTTLLQADGNPLGEAVQYGTLIRDYPMDTRYVGASTSTSDPAFLFFTSGTTGPPKMVVHNHLYPLSHTTAGRSWLMLGPGKLFWSLAEQGWAKAAWSWFSAWNTGAALYVKNLKGSFSPSGIIETMHRYPITTLCVPPTAFRRLVLPDMGKLMQEMPPQRLEHCVAAGEALEAEVVRAWKKLTGIEIKDGYGQTETTLICGNFPGYPVKPGSMGIATPGMHLSIVDNDGRECDPGVEGNIALGLRHMQQGEPLVGVFDGYLQEDGGKIRKVQQRASRSGEDSSSPQQWYLTGDRGSRDEDGYFWFVGRSDDVINSSGYRIGPSEVEAVLQEHPAVLESAVIASPSAERGDVVKAFIILTDAGRREDPAALMKDIQDHCKRTAAPYKYPRRIEFVGPDFFPKTVSGKIQRAKLREMEKRKHMSLAKL